MKKWRIETGENDVYKCVRVTVRMEIYSGLNGEETRCRVLWVAPGKSKKHGAALKHGTSRT